MSLDPHWKLQAATYETFGADALRVVGTRAGNRFTIKVIQGDKTEEREADLPDDGHDGMDFVLAAFLPLAKGTRFPCADINEAAGFQKLGPATFTVVGDEKRSMDGEETKVWRVNRECQRDGKPSSLPLWIDAERRIVKTDWGDGLFLCHRRQPTKHLFQPNPPK